MPNFFTDNEDLQYYFRQTSLDWPAIVRAVEGEEPGEDGLSSTEEAVELYRDVLDTIGKFVAEEVAPHALEIDQQGQSIDGEEVAPAPRIDSIFAKLKDLGMYAMTLPRELDGLNTPSLIYYVASEIFARADVSTMAHFGFHGGIAMALLAFSGMEGSAEIDPKTGRITKTRFDDEISEIVRGDAWGSMDITEPNAGSDMAQLRARAEQDEDGQWYVTGEKIFITSGHGKYHLVIARTEDAKDPTDPFSGLGGLSMFLVPTYREDESGQRVRLAKLERVEDKLGHHGSVTATVTFDRTPAQLIGERGEGFKYMLKMMNGARIGVGFESIGICEAAYRQAKAYAAERPSMGKTIDRHEMIADYLDRMEIEIVGLRALAMKAAYHQEIAQRGEFSSQLFEADPLKAKRIAKEAKRHQRRARRLTPLLKYLSAEKAVEITRLGLQIHGGNGYMTEYGAEKLLRDAVVMPIYEGTSQIQSLMAMKDTLTRVMKNPQAFIRNMAQARWRSLSAADPLERRLAKVQHLSLSAQQHLMRKTASDKLRSVSHRPIGEWKRELFKEWNPKRDFAYAMLHAERLTQLLSVEAIGECLMEQARTDESRRELLERYLDRIEPLARMLHDEITTTGKGVLSRLGKLEGEGTAERRAG